MRVDPEDLRAYARRPWGRAEDAKREFIAARWREDPDAHVRAIHALADHLRAVRPEWPTPEELARDLADHVELKRKLDRAAGRLAGR